MSDEICTHMPDCVRQILGVIYISQINFATIIFVLKTAKLIQVMIQFQSIHKNFFYRIIVIKCHKYYLSVRQSGQQSTFSLSSTFQTKNQNYKKKITFHCTVLTWTSMERPELQTK